MLKFLSRMSNRDLYITIKSPPEQYRTSKFRIKEEGGEIKPFNQYQNAIIVFDKFLGSSNSKYIDQCFIRGRHDNSGTFCLSQYYFDLPKRTIRMNRNKLILFNQTVQDIENIYRTLVDAI